MKKFNFRKVLDGLTASSPGSGSGSGSNSGGGAGSGSTHPAGTAGILREEIQETLTSDYFQICKTVRHGFPYQPTTLAFDPVQKILAIGTRTGAIRILGRPGVDCYCQHESGAAVLQLQFLINEGALVSASSDDTLHLWNLRQKRPAILHSLKFNRERITYCHLPFQSKWLYVGTERGNTHIVNIESFILSGYVIMWNKAIELSTKTHPGPVVHLSDSPRDEGKKICGSNYPLSIIFIVVNEFCERFSYYGMKAVLTLYFLYYLNWSEDTSTSVYHAFSSLCYFTPILGAAIADSWLGKFKTIIYLSLVYVLGHVIKSMSALPILAGQNLHIVLSMVGLSLIALGTGGIKPCVAAFGGDQFEEKHAEERTRYFSVFYLSINAGSLISTFVTPMLRGDVECFGKDCYALAFGVPGLLMLIALVVFAMGSKLYRKPPPEGNILNQLVKCIWFAISSRFKNHSEDNPKREHWLDWAAEKYPKQLIMDVKALTRVLFLYIPLPMFWALLDQQGSRWTLQATRMNGNLGFFVLQPDQIQVLNPFLIVIFIPLFDLVIYRLVSKCGINFTSLRKMAVGMILACLGFAVAAAVEIKINEMATCQPNSQEIFLQVLNLADDEVKVTVLGDENNTLLAESIKSFQNMPHYSKLHLKTKSQNFHFQLKYHNVSVYTEHPVEEKMLYTLIIREDGKSISSMMVKDEENKTTNGITAMRFVNTLHEEVNVSLGTDASLIVAEDYGVSAYRTVQRGEYPVVHCRTKNEDFSLNLGLVDFGAAYLFVITNLLENGSASISQYEIPRLVANVNLYAKRTNQGLQAWKMEYIPANKMSIAWQLPQYALVTAGEVMFSVTGLEFSYSQAPSSMKSVLQAAWLLTIAFGNIIVLIVAQFSGLAQWAEFIFFSCLMLVVCLIFSIMGYYYVPLKPEDVQGSADKQTPQIQGNVINLETKKTRL